MKLITRRKLLIALAVMVAGALALAGYARYIEPSWFALDRRRVPVDSAKVNSRLRILHLSDFHASRFVSFEAIEKAIRMGIDQRPDLICLTGDFICTRIPDADRYAELLRRLSSAAPTFACPGNHDGGEWSRVRGGLNATDSVAALLRESGVRLLKNDATEESIAGCDFRIIGLGDLWAGEIDPRPELFANPDGRFALLLCHNPDAKSLLADMDWDLMLCGHTHGGQLRIPFVGTPYAPVHDHDFVEGLHRWNGRWIYTTRGVGNLHAVRFNCRPQVSILEIGPP